MEVHLRTDEMKRQLIIQDNGIGMTAEEIEENLGTIAKSGSREYVARLQSDQTQAPGVKETDNIIGRFGVGFYAAFMVADKVLSPACAQVNPGSGQHLGVLSSSIKISIKWHS